MRSITRVLTTAKVVETSVPDNNNNNNNNNNSSSPIQDYVHPDDYTQLTYKMTPGFKLSQ